MKHSAISKQTPRYLFFLIAFLSVLAWDVGIEADSEHIIPTVPLCCLLDKTVVIDEMWQEVDATQVERIIAFTQNYPALPMVDGVKLLTGIGGRGAALERLLPAARALVLSDEPDSKKKEQLKALRKEYKEKFGGFDDLHKFLKGLALDDKLIINQWDPNDKDKNGVYEKRSKYHHKERDQDRTLFWGVTIIKASLENILKAQNDFSEYNSENLKRGFLEISVVPDSYYRGQDAVGNPVQTYQVQFTQDVEKVGRRTYRIANCHRFVNDKATEQYYLRFDTQLRSLAEEDPQELERLVELYGEDARKEFLDPLYSTYLYLPVDGAEPDTAYCLVHYFDVNPRKSFENSRFAAGGKAKVPRADLADLKLRAERLEGSEGK